MGELKFALVPYLCLGNANPGISAFRCKDPMGKGPSLDAMLLVALTRQCLHRPFPSGPWVLRSVEGKGRPGM